jgi:hypothetical protein
MLVGDIPLAPETFSFGNDGKPFVMSGPNDSPTRIRRIVDTLAKRAGPGGFDYVVHVADFSDGELSFFAGPVLSTELESSDHQTGDAS